MKRLWLILFLLFVSCEEKKNGLYTVYWNSGQKKVESTYKSGELDGRWTSWHENGQKQYEMTYKDGILIFE